MQGGGTVPASNGSLPLSLSLPYLPFASSYFSLVWTKVGTSGVCSGRPWRKKNMLFRGLSLNFSKSTGSFLKVLSFLLLTRVQTSQVQPNTQVHSCGVVCKKLSRHAQASVGDAAKKGGLAKDTGHCLECSTDLSWYGCRESRSIAERKLWHSVASFGSTRAAIHPSEDSLQSRTFVPSETQQMPAFVMRATSSVQAISQVQRGIEVTDGTKATPSGSCESPRLEVKRSNSTLSLLWERHHQRHRGGEAPHL